MWFLAIRHLIARKKQTILTLLGIFFGATAFIVISAFFLGFQGYLIEQLLDNDAHIRVSAREEFLNPQKMSESFFPEIKAVFWDVPPGGRRDNARIENPQGWYRILEKSPDVVAYSPQLVAQSIVNRADATLSARVIGSDPLRQQRVTNIQSYMTNGKFSDIAVGGNRLIIGEELLKKLGGRVSETLMVSTGKYSPVPFKIVGTFRVGIKSLDEGVAFAALSDVQKLNGTPSLVNEIAIRVRDVDRAKLLSETWKNLGVERVESWDQANANILNVFVIQNATRYMMIAVIIIVAGFGVYNILNMVVNQKRKEIAILRSMGFERSDIVQLFLSQGVILGIIGGILGMIAGYWISRLIESIPFAGGGFGSGKGTLQVSFDYLIYVRGFVIAVISSAFASYLPARAAGKMLPIEIIRAGAE